MDKIVWSYEWDDGARLELLETPNNFVLYEYDANGDVVVNIVRDGYSLTQSDCCHYRKKDWTLDEVIADIEAEYYI